MGDALDQVLLAVEEQQQAGDHIDHGDGEGNADLAGVDRGQVHRQGLLGGVGQQDQRLLDHVPVVDEDQNRDGIEGAAALGQADILKNLELAGAVQLGGLDQGIGDAPHKLGEQKHREGREGAGQDNGPTGIEDAQPVADQVIGHQGHLVGHQHQNDVGKENHVADLAAPAGEAVGRHRGNNQLQNHDGHHQNHRIPELQEIVRAPEQDGNILGKAHLVGDKFQVDGIGNIAGTLLDRGEDLAVVGRDFALGHKGVGNGQDRGQQKQQGEHRRQDGQGRAAKEPGLFHPSTSFPNQFSTAKRMAISTTMPRARITAAAESRW